MIEWLIERGAHRRDMRVAMLDCRNPVNCGTWSEELRREQEKAEPTKYYISLPHTTAQTNNLTKTQERIQ